MKSILYVGLGGALGSILRYLVSFNFSFSSIKFPLATFFVNIIGSFIIGMGLGYFQKHQTLESNMALFIMTGFCGGFTTFSTFSKENLHLIQTGNYMMFCLYAFLSVIVCIVAVALGHYILK